MVIWCGCSGLTSRSQAECQKVVGSLSMAAAASPWIGGPHCASAGSSLEKSTIVQLVLSTGVPLNSMYMGIVTCSFSAAKVSIAKGSGT